MLPSLRKFDAQSEGTLGTKRLRVELKDSSYSKYGVTTGWCDLGKTAKPLLITIERCWPSWGLVAASAGVELVVLVLLDPYWKRWCETYLTSTRVLLYEDFMACKAELAQVDIIVSDIDIPPSFKLWDKVKGAYISRRSVRNSKTIPPDFTAHRLNVIHTQGGGEFRTGPGRLTST